MCPLCRQEAALNEYDVCAACYASLRKGVRSIDLFRTEDVNPFGDHVRLMARMARRAIERAPQSTQAGTQINVTPGEAK